MLGYYLKTTSNTSALQCRYIVESSSYWMQAQLETLFILVAHKLNDTEIDSCVTPNFEYKRIEQLESICKKWFLFDK